ncbi:MAG: hypothetical protein VB108_07870 [Anaerolineaceae bacterium]|nr:hypothetical protein [Anaerolineaceae bacterium]
MSKSNAWIEKLKNWIFDNKVFLVFAILCIGATIVSKSPLFFVVDGVFTRIGRNTFTVLALIIPVLAGMGLNFGIVIGAIAAQIALFCTVYWGFTGFPGMLLTVAITTPLAILFGYLVGKVMNTMKGAEMIAGMILGYFTDGLYQLLFLVLIGGVIPINKTHPLIIPGGVGVRNTVDLSANMKYSLDNVSMLDILTFVAIAIGLIFLVKLLMAALKKYHLKTSDFVTVGVVGAAYAISYIPMVEAFLGVNRLKLLDGVSIILLAVALWQLYLLIKNVLIDRKKGYSWLKPMLNIALCAAVYGLTFIPELEQVMMMVKIPVLPYLLIAALCLFNRKILDTRIGQNMRTVGQSQTVATASGIDVDKTRIIAMIISTVLAGWGQLIYLQNIGAFATYGAHLQIGQFAIAALLVGGASVQKANNKQAIIGVILFHLLFIVAPQAGKMLFNNAQIGEYFRVFVSYGVIALSLAMHAWKKAKKEPEEKHEESPALPASTTPKAESSTN